MRQPKSYTRCDRIMIGSGTDTYDPTCDLPANHDGECMSTAARDQHRLPERCAYCREWRGLEPVLDAGFWSMRCWRHRDP